MTTTKDAEPAIVDDVSISTLEGTPGRALMFLRGVGTTPRIRGQLSPRGYTEAEHARGWALLHAASGYHPASPSGLATESDPEVLHAISEISAWEEDGYRIVRAALTRQHPAQAKQVLDGIAPDAGPGAIMFVKTLIERVEQLGHGHSAADHAALRTVEQRGITPAERQRLKALVKIAEKGASPVATEPSGASAGDVDLAHHLDALRALRAWYVDWSDMARATIKRRDWLIRIGLAKRKNPPRKVPAHSAAPTPSATAS